MRNEFRILVHESSGQRYEDLFVKIMGYADESFKPVKAHGNIGDRGNDGWVEKEGKYFQVFSPTNIPRNNSNLIRKMREDFQKLISYWEDISPVKKYVFVYNDKFLGVSPHIYDELKKLKIKYELISAEVFLAADLERLLFSQSKDVIESVLNFSTSRNSANAIYERLVKLITKKMFLNFWSGISENLISQSLESIVLNGFAEASMTVFKMDMPGEIPSFENSVKVLAGAADDLCLHFTNSECAFQNYSLKSWSKDMRWKRTWLEPHEYNFQYMLHENWSRNLLILHCELVAALNEFSSEVRSHINSDYMNGEKFTIVDSMGTYNQFNSYEAIPKFKKD